ncbi:MAG: efflux RND transporter periplasmic adaptor subunit [Acidobacteriota bacterium]|nr:efflux RND transporter periplasmic adaptor subunit [Acidobacteriota bacterium]
MKKLTGALALLLLGAALPVAIIWNPLHWSWADALTARPRAGSMAEPMKKQAAAASSNTPTQRKIKYWRASMNPTEISSKPGKDSMGMDLVPVYEDEQGQESGIRVDPSFLQNFGVRTVRAETGSIPVNIRTVGLLNYNEKDLAFINTKFEGWIEKAYVNYVGEPVNKGQVLFEIYSPQLVTTQQDYLSALEYVQKLSGRADPDAVARARSLLDATRERLHYWDITEGQIDELQRAGKSTRTLKVVSPVAGVVVAKMSDSLEGMKLAAGMNVYKIADLSTIWASVQVYEDRIRYMQPGRLADITVDAFPNRHWSGKIIYLDPTVNQQTRTLTAYVQIPNRDLKLHPQMYADVEVSVPAVSGVVKVPEEAVLHSGERSVVIVEKVKGLFEPRDVELGALGDGFREIRKGVRAGESVVTSSQFLIDSESNLKEAVKRMLAERTAAAGQKPVPASPADGAMKMPKHEH